MVCPKCGSENVTVQMVTDTQLKTGHGFIWWLLVGWWWVPIKWLCFFWIALFAKIFGSKNYKMKTTHASVCVCQSCGHHWTPEKAAPASTAPSTLPQAATPVRLQAMPTQQYIGGCEVVGESYYKDAIAALGTIQRDYYWPVERLYEKFVEGDRVYKYQFDDMDAELVLEPENPYDPNAIRVDIDGEPVGHIAKENTERIRELLDAGASVRAKISAGPYKEISETPDGLLASEKTDFDFRVWLSFFENKKKPVEAPRELEPQTETKRSPVLAKIAAVLMWIFLAISIAAVLAAIIAGVVLGAIPEQYVLYVFGVAVIGGILTWIFSSVAYA